MKDNVRMERMNQRIHDDSEPKKKWIGYMMLAFLLVFLLLSAALYFEKSYWTDFPAERYEMADVASLDSGTVGLSMTSQAEGILVEGYLFDLREPTRTSSKSVVLRPSGAEVYFKLPTMMVKRHDLTERFGQQYDGAGFAAWIPASELRKYGPCRLYIMDEDNGKHRLVDMGEELGR